MKFKFAFEKLLDHFDRKEKVAQRDFRESLHLLDKEKDLLNHFQKSIGTALEKCENLSGETSGIDIGSVRLWQDYAEGLKILSYRQTEIIKTHQHIVDQKQEILLAATREKKTFEKLKEKRKAEFKINERKREAKINDELVVTRFKRESANE